MDHRHQGHLPVVDGDKDWWEKLEWDGLEAGHDPSLFKLHHSMYYNARRSCLEAQFSAEQTWPSNNPSLYFLVRVNFLSV
jgi:hypothetical protein